MSTITYIRVCIEATKGQPGTRRSLSASVHAFWAGATMVYAFFHALYDGLVEYRQYERLKSWGVAHDIALRTAVLQWPTIGQAGEQ
jgi:hypothetical protein